MVDKRAVLARAVGNGSWRSIAASSIDRKKTLQTATFKTMRAMRSMVCGFLPIPGQGAWARY